MRDLVRVWTIVLAMNVVGAFLFALVLARTDLMQRDVAEALLAVATPALQHDFLRTMLRGIFAGWLIALMVWLQPGADSARIWVILIITWIVGAAEFSHIVAGSVEVLYLVCRGMATATEFVRDFFLPTLLGNVIGGVSLVAALGHAQVRQK